MGTWTAGQRPVVKNLIAELMDDGFIHTPSVGGAFSEILFRDNEVAKIYDDSAYDRYLAYVEDLDDRTHHPVRLSNIEAYDVEPYMDDNEFSCWGTNESVRIVLLRREYPLSATSRFCGREPIVYNRAFADLVDDGDSTALETIFNRNEMHAVHRVLDFAEREQLTADMRTCNFATDEYERLVILDPVWDPNYISERNHTAVIPMRYRFPKMKKIA